MPQKIKPIIDVSVGGRTYDLDAGGDWSWLRRQEVSYNRAYASIGNATRGKIGGGPTYQQWLSADDPKKFTVLADPPPLTTAILDGGVAGGTGRRRVGQLNLDLIDPFGSMAQASGTFVGQDQPAFGTGGSAFDPGAFLASKGIDIFGTNDVGVPARLADYALAFPLAVMNKMRGVASAEPSANNPLKYRFQGDPGYWDLLRVADTDDELRAIARTVASRYIDPSRNSYLVQQLFEQMRSDRDEAVTAKTSGNVRIDYLAKWQLAADMTSFATSPTGLSIGGDPVVGAGNFMANLVGAIPFVGTQIAAGLAPVDQWVAGRWDSLTPDERRAYYLRAGIQIGVTDIVTQLPLLSGLGSAMAVMKGSQGIGGVVYKAYDTTLRGTSLMMGAGLVVATANWAAEAAWPGYSEFLGEEIDRARPISKSSLAGVVNELGFWSSGSFGVIPAVQIATRTTGRVTGVAADGLEKLHVPRPTIGERELSFFRDGYGGSAARTELAGAGLTGVDTAVKASFLSHLLNWVERDRRSYLEAALRGEETPWAHVNAMDPPTRTAWVNDQLARGMADGPQAVETLIRLLAFGRTKRPVNPSDEARRMHEVARNMGRTIDEQLTADVVGMYGPNFVAGSRIVGRYDDVAMETWVRNKVTELGGDGTKIGKHDSAGWERLIRTLHQYEYHHLNGELDAAIQRASTEEGGKLAIIASDHVFRGEAEALLAALEGLDELAQRRLIANTIKTKREAAAWYATQWRPKAGHAKQPENVAPATFIEWLEDAMPALPTRRLNADPASSTALDPINAFQRQIDAQGTWTLAFKPVDGDGNFVSYTQTRGGGVVRSPWVEYPLTGGDNIELGNRGYAAGKIEAALRGFRTRRLTELQRGAIFRQLSTQADVLPEQIDAFHEGILRLAHDNRVPPQTVGTVAKLPEMAYGLTTRKQINDLAESIFGPGDLRGRDGKPIAIDWADLISKAYRQSFKLNMTSGLTSWLKSLGPIGAAASVASDIMYVAWRFGFSPLFKGGEIVESPGLNALRGVFGRDPLTEALFVRNGGVGNDASVLLSEMNFDAATQALTSRRDLTPGQRLAAALSFHARHLPDDLASARETASTQGVADDFRAAHGGGSIPDYAVPGDIIPEGPAIYDPARPVGRTVPVHFSTDPADFLDDGVYGLDDIEDAADRGMWHTTTAIDSVLRNGLKSRRQLELERQAAGPETVAREGDLVWTGDGRSHTVAGPAFRPPPDPALRKELKLARAERTRVLNLYNKTFKEMSERSSAEGDRTLDDLAVRNDRAHNRLANAEQAWEWQQDWLVPVRASRLIDDLVTNLKAKHFVSIEDGVSGEVRWQPEATGLGGGSGDAPHVSVTVSKEHADLIAGRLRLAVRAARGQASVREILEHFGASDFYNSGDELVDIAKMESALIWSLRTAKPATSWDDFVRQVEKSAVDPAMRYNLVKVLDGQIAREAFDEWNGAVVLVGSWEQMRGINPEQIGTVQVAARAGSDELMWDYGGVQRPTTPRDFVKRVGPDPNEIQFAPEGLFVIDDRPALPPLGDSEDVLIRQLRATLRIEPGQVLAGSLADDLKQVVGEHGIHPGLEGRAAAILERLEELARNRGDDGPVFRWDHLTARQQAEALAKLYDSGDLARPALDAPSPHTPDEVSAAWERFQRRPGTADTIDDIAGTPEALFEHTLPAFAEEQIRAGAKGWMRRALETFWHPTGMKQGQALALQVRLMQDQFPALLRASGMDGNVQVFRELGIPENQWASWLLEDRRLMDEWLNAKADPDAAAAAFAKLVDHAGDDVARADFDELYASEEWATISSLWALNIQSTRDEAFGVHFFAPYRSAFERSVNHPVLGVYPASWTLKAAREWARFLFDNRTFGELRLGMAPAQAIANIARAQASAWAQTHDESLAEWYEKGPLGSTIFIFNLLMPGDWSSLPFPLSRSIREVLRGRMNPAEILAANLDFLGATRDGQLIAESLGELHGLVFDEPPEDPKRLLTGVSVRGVEDQFGDPRR